MGSSSTDIFFDRDLVVGGNKNKGIWNLISVIVQRVVPLSTSCYV